MLEINGSSRILSAQTLTCSILLASASALLGQATAAKQPDDAD